MLPQSTLVDLYPPMSYCKATHRCCFLLTLFLLLFSFTATAQQTRAYNRFQYHKYTWKVLHTDAFHLYYPAGYDSLASFASVQLPDIIPEVKAATGTTVNSVPNLLIYPSTDQLYESNVGLNDNHLQTFPTINLKGSRVLVAFNGSYEAFRAQLKEAWVRLTWEEQFKSNAAEQITNRQQTVPQWLKEGLIRYFASGWSAEEETALYHYLHDHGGDTAVSLPETVPNGGKAFCYFLEHRYREDASFQLFFQIKQGKSLSRAIRLITKRRLDTLVEQCGRYYRERFAAASDRLYRQLPERLPEDDSLGYLRPYTDSPGKLPSDTMPLYLEQRFKARLLSLNRSADHNRLYFVLQRYSRRDAYSITIAELKDRKFKPKSFLHYLLPPWISNAGADPYPVLYCPPEQGDISAVVPEKGKLQLKIFSSNGSYKDSRTLYGVDGVSSLFPYGPGQWLLAASRRSRSDIVIFDGQRLRYEPLTSGLADHDQLAISPDNKQIAFRSGYPTDSLFHKDTAARAYGIYEKALYSPKVTAHNKAQLMVKDTAYIRWQYPAYRKEGMLYSSSTRTGVLVAEPVQEQWMQWDTAQDAPWLKDYRRDLAYKDSIKALLEKANSGEPSFLEKVLSPGDTRQAAAQQRDSLRRAVAYAGKKIRPYILQLYSAYFSAQINNDYYINRYQPFQAYLGTFKFPEVGAMVQGGLSDILEHHHFNIGYQLPAGSEGSNFFVRYENTARRLDWHVLFFRKVESLQPDPDRDWKDEHGNPYPAAAKVKTHYYELGFHYPLHYDWSLDFTTTARRDRTIFLATDRYSLTYEALQTWWSISTLSLGVNKLQPALPMMYQGWSGKITADGMGSTGKASTILYGTHLQLEGHQPLFKGITFVARVQASYSGGESKILYNFGGMDNNVVPRVDTTVKFAQQAPYAFQSLVTPFRGYAQNSIYGSRFGLLNADVYVPLFYRLLPLHTGFSAVNNLQLGLFTDIAGVSGNQGLPATSNHLWSYGFSARTLLAGYPIRFDMAWPGSFDKQPVWYLSLTLH